MTTAIIILSIAVLVLAIGVGALSKFLWTLRTDLSVLVDESAATREDLAIALETKEAELQDAHASIEMVLDAPVPASEAPPTNKEKAAYEELIRELQGKLRAAETNLEMVLDAK